MSHEAHWSLDPETQVFISSGLVLQQGNPSFHCHRFICPTDSPCETGIPILQLESAENSLREHNIMNHYAGMDNLSSPRRVML